jgi:ribosome-associated translation inhibitor RaiA
MTINLHFSHVEVPDYLRYNIEGYITEMFGSLSEKNNLFVDLFCKKEVTTKTNAEKFKCHIEAHAPWLNKKIYIQATGDECWDTIISASGKMKRKLYSHKKSNHRRKSRPDWSLTETDDVNEQELVL